YAKPGTKRTVVVLDFGMKNSILRELNKRNCNAIVLPYIASISEIMAFNPDGILLSNGPGDPLEMTTIAETVAELEKHVPIFGICMGHQIRSEEHTSELQSRFDLVCRLLLEKKK